VGQPGGSEVNGSPQPLRFPAQAISKHSTSRIGIRGICAVAHEGAVVNADKTSEIAVAPDGSTPK